MADITRSASASMDASTGMYAVQITGLIAGEALDLVAPCYIKTSDGKVYMCDGSAADELAEFVGMTPRAVAIGQPVTLFSCGARFRYGVSLSPGAKVFLSATPGLVGDAATTGGTLPLGVVLNSTDILITTAQGS